MFLIPERVVRIAQHDPIIHTVTKAFIYPGPVTWAIGGLVLLVNFFFIYRAMRWRRQFLLQMTIYNLVFLGAWFFFVPLADQFSRNVLFPYPPPYDPYYAGYHVGVLPILVMVGLLAIWFRAQWKLTRGRKRKVDDSGW